MHTDLTNVETLWFSGCFIPLHHIITGVRSCVIKGCAVVYVMSDPAVGGSESCVSYRKTKAWAATLINLTWLWAGRLTEILLLLSQKIDNINDDNIMNCITSIEQLKLTANLNVYEHIIVHTSYLWTHSVRISQTLFSNALFWSCTTTGQRVDIKLYSSGPT